MKKYEGKLIVTLNEGGYMITISNPEKYSVGILLRLSNEKVEDLKRYGESGSITNQKDLLLNFCKENKLKIYDIYSDDGESGAFYDRPEFKRMIKDIDLGNVNLVVVKDLSRFGRVASGIDEYIEEYFQLKGVRFIAVNENLDSKTSANFFDDIKFRAFFNEWFLRDCSKKTRDGKHNKALQGKVMTTYPKYGYLKDSNNKNHYVPNEETAPIVTNIFNELKCGTLPSVIANKLNQEKVPTPAESVGNVRYRKAKEIKRKWNKDTIIRIARDKTYLGYVINGKRKKLSYKSKKIMLTKEEDYIVVKNKHEPLIDKETFDIVKNLIDSRKHTRIYKYDFLLKGLIECAECGKKLSVISIKHKSGNVVQYLRCNTYASNVKLKVCTPHSNNCEKLTNIIIETIISRLLKYKKEEEYYLIAKNIKDKMTFNKNLIPDQIELLKSRLEIQNKKINQIYEDKLNGVINQEDFERMYKLIIDKKEEIKKSIEALSHKKEYTPKEIDLRKIVKEFINDKKITREMLVSLIDKITVSEDKEIKIYYKFNLSN